MDVASEWLAPSRLADCGVWPFGASDRITSRLGGATMQLQDRHRRGAGGRDEIGLCRVGRVLQTRALEII